MALGIFSFTEGSCKAQSEIRTVTNGLVLAGPQLESCLLRETSAETRGSAGSGTSGTKNTPCPPIPSGAGQDGEAWPCWGGGWLGLSQLGSFLPTSRGFVVLPTEARGPHTRVTCRHRPLCVRPRTSLHL